MAAETKRLSVRLLDVKTSGLAERQFKGHGAVFRNLDRGGDIIVPGAFRKTLEQHAAEGSWPVMLFGHDHMKVPGKWLDMREDATGLAVTGEFARTPLGDECRELVKSGSLSGMSIGYLAREVDWDRDGNRLLKEVELLECSLVSLPMNPQAQVQQAKDIADIRQWEHRLRDLGFGRRASVRLAAKTWGVIAAELEVDPIQVARDLATDLAEQQAITSLLVSANNIRGL